MKQYSHRFDLQELSRLHFRCNCTLGQLNNEGGGELHEIKWSQDKTEIGKEHDKE